MLSRRLEPKTSWIILGLIYNVRLEKLSDQPLGVAPILKLLIINLESCKGGQKEPLPGRRIELHLYPKSS